MTVENRDTLGMTDGQTVYGVRLQALAKAAMGYGPCIESTASAIWKAVEASPASMLVRLLIGPYVHMNSGNGRTMVGGISGAPAPLGPIESYVAVSISAAHATLPRMDIIYWNAAGTLSKTNGTPLADNPQVPAMPDEYCIPLAVVRVIPQNDALYTGTITDAYITDVRCPVSPAYEPITEASDTLKAYQDAERLTTQLCPTLGRVKQLRLLETVSGIRVKYAARNRVSGAVGNLELYLNYTKVGTAQAITTAVYATYTQDIVVNARAGDILGLWGCQDVTGEYIYGKEFRVYYDRVLQGTDSY